VSVILLSPASGFLDFFDLTSLPNPSETSTEVRGLNGVQAEWIAQASDWKKAKRHEKEKEEKEAREEGSQSGPSKDDSKKKKMKTKIDKRHERPHDKNYLMKKKDKFMKKREEKKEGMSKAEGQEDEDEDWEEEEQNRDALGGQDDRENIEEFDRLKRVMVSLA